MLIREKRNLVKSLRETKGGLKEKIEFIDKEIIRAKKLIRKLENLVK